MYRILFLADDAARLKERVLGLAAHLASRGWPVHGMARGASACAACRAGFAATIEPPWAGPGPGWAGLPGAAGRLRAAVTGGGYDVVHIVSPSPGVFARFALAGLGASRPRVIYDALGPELSSWGQSLAARWTDHLVTPDYASYTSASNRLLLPVGRTHLVPAPKGGAPGGYLASWDALYAQVLDLPEAAPRPTERLRVAGGKPRRRPASALSIEPR